HVARLLAQLLRQAHGAVGLVVAVLWVLRRLDHRDVLFHVRSQAVQRDPELVLDQVEDLHNRSITVFFKRGSGEGPRKRRYARPGRVPREARRGGLYRGSGAGSCSPLPRGGEGSEEAIRLASSPRAARRPRALPARSTRACPGRTRGPPRRR